MMRKINKELKINELLSLFLEQNKKSCFDEVIQEFCITAGIRNWEVFKEGNNIKSFYSKNLKREIIICSDSKKNKPGYCWTTTELEYAFKNNFSTEKLDKVDYLKNNFQGIMITN